MRRFFPIVFTAWIGSLWTICFLVAPLTFATLGDRHLAGQLTGRLFRIEAWAGAAIGALLIVLLVARRLRPGGRVSCFLVALTAGSPLLSQIALTPFMDAARTSGDMSRFGMLHAIAGGLFFLACLSGLALLLRFSRPAE